jgi:hypothetical protein
MSTATARQLDFGDLGVDLPTRRRSAGSDNGIGNARVADSSVTAAPTLNVPDFGARGVLYAITSREAGRLNAASIPESEHKALLRERQKLLDKRFAGTISHKETCRLEYVRWSLDRIEDAKYGRALDRLDGLSRLYEQFVSNVNSLNDQIEPQTGRRK